MKTITKAEALLLDLFRARAAAKAEKARFTHAVQLRGGWRCRPDYLHDDDGLNRDGTVKEACWTFPDKPKCPDCRVLGPYHAAYRKAAHRAGVALRKATTEGQRIFFAKH